MRETRQKLSEAERRVLASALCERCIFKSVDYAAYPCLTCEKGIYGGTDKNFVDEK